MITNSGDTTVSVLLGNGDGTFQTHQDYQAGPVPTSVAIGDLNGDGNLDLAIANFSSIDTVMTIQKIDNVAIGSGRRADVNAPTGS